MKGNLLYRSHGLCVPTGAREELLTDAHTRLGHPGEEKFKRAVSTQFHWPKMSRQITSFLQRCKPCSEQKYNRGKAAGLLRSFPLPFNKWSEIAMDFMNRTEFDCNGTLYNQVLLVVDRATRFLVAIPCHSSWKPPQLIYALHREIYCPFGFPDVIVSDRDPRFIAGIFQQHLKS